MEVDVMKTCLIVLLCLVPYLLSAVLVANLSERSCIQTDFDSRLILAENDSTFCLYHWNYSPNDQQLSLKRLHANGTQDDEMIIYDFGGSYQHELDLYVSGSVMMIFEGTVGLACLKVNGETVQAYHLPWGTQDGPQTGYMYYNIGNSLLFLGPNVDYDYCLWQWNYETGVCSLIYNSLGLFGDVHLSVFGNRPVLSGYRTSHNQWDPMPVVIFDEDFNTVIQYSDKSLGRSGYQFDEQTCYAYWYQQADSNNNGIVYLHEDTLEYFTWAGTCSLDPWSEGYHPMFKLPNNIHAVKYGHGGIYGDYTSYHLYEHLGPGNVVPYNALPNLNTYPDTLRFVGKMHNRLLTIGKGSGPYIFRLADIQTSQWAEFSQNQWTPQEEVVRSAKAYNTDDYVLYKIQSWDMEENIIQRFYFLKVEQSVSNDDPINPPVVLNAYPNPFKDRIRISTKDSPQTQPLDIYNLRGQKVKSLAPAADGYEWDGRDEQGNPVSVGIYFARNPHSKSAIKLVKLQP